MQIYGEGAQISQKLTLSARASRFKAPPAFPRLIN